MAPRPKVEADNNLKKKKRASSDVFCYISTLCFFFFWLNISQLNTTEVEKVIKVQKKKEYRNVITHNLV